MFARLLSKLATNMLLSLAVALLMPIPVIGVIAEALAFVC